MVTVVSLAVVAVVSALVSVAEDSTVVSAVSSVVVTTETSVVAVVSVYVVVSAVASVVVTSVVTVVPGSAFALPYRSFGSSSSVMQ